ncbi:Mu transposase C-terminal domain-containing protein [Stenotrophomonas oahuensis]|uniref:DDE-type integrase/transposase/recombinase n=1 Tax=Stenotrophomonas oahuensis TaxID=3003271 RepID=A0ABY9YMB0_9GAMM|nr:Mu transposase C-terminal domain-containing protein [Stenotrophomonas sp. A5586]WNH52037.1 DDE-type integrase/transposase/recombinase [Stenotrophomonas sp. A5586]
MSAPKRESKVTPDLRIRKGLVAVSGGRAVVVLGVHKEGIHLRVQGTDEIFWADPSMIEPFVSGTSARTIRAISDSDPKDEKEAANWCDTLAALLKQSNGVVSRKACAAVALELGVHPSTVRRRIKNYRDNPVPASQLRAIPGPSPGSRRLRPVAESLIDKAIDGTHLTRERPPLSAVVRRVAALSKEAGIPAPGRKAIRARIAARSPMEVAKKRLGGHDAHAQHAPSVKGIEVSRPLEAVQIDHALVDLIVVSAESRKPIGRPWITVAIDVLTRCILGYYLSFDPPNQTSVAHALEHASFPKQPWLKSLGLDLHYPMFGKIECVHWDNAKTFQARDVRAQCERYGIRVNERPVRSPHYGAYVERVIGTMMGAVHLLPGTTFSNVKARGSYQSERRAVMSFQDLEKWLAEEIAGQYHNRPHKGLRGLTPAAAWEAAWIGKRGETILPPMIGDQRAFVVGFYPSVTRKVTREGVVVKGLRYWDPCLTPFINDQIDHQIHYSQRDLSKVYLRHGCGFLDVPLIDRSLGAFSWWELREARSELKARGKLASSSSELFESMQRQRSIQIAAESTSKAARRKVARFPKLEAPAGTDLVDYAVAAAAFDWDDGVIE